MPQERLLGPSLTAVVALSAVMAAAGRVFPVLYFPATCFLGFYFFREEIMPFAVLAAVLTAVFYFSATGFYWLLALAAAATGIVAGKFSGRPDGYLKSFAFTFFFILSAALIGFSGKEIIPLFGAKLGRMFILTLAAAGGAGTERASEMAYSTLQVLPAITAVFAVIGFFINIYVISAASGKRPGAFAVVADFTRYGVWVLALSLAGIALGDGGIVVISKNLFIAAIFIYFLSGLDIYYLMLRKSKTPAIIRMLFMGILIFMYPVPVITGVLDVWIGLRNKIKSSRLPHGQEAKR